MSIQSHHLSLMPHPDGASVLESGDSRGRTTDTVVEHRPGTRSRGDARLTLRRDHGFSPIPAMPAESPNSS